MALLWKKKTTLLVIVKHYKPELAYEIDEILGQYGHTVLLKIWIPLNWFEPSQNKWSFYRMYAQKCKGTIWSCIQFYYKSIYEGVEYLDLDLLE